MTQDYQLESVTVHRRETGWGAEKTAYYVCKVDVKGVNAKHEIVLDAALSAEVMRVIGSAIRENAARLVERLAADLAQAGDAPAREGVEL